MQRDDGSTRTPPGKQGGHWLAILYIQLFYISNFGTFALTFVNTKVIFAILPRIFAVAVDIVNG